MDASVQKLLWFQDAIKQMPTKEQFTPAEVCDIIAKYLERYDTEIERIEDKGERFKARPPSARKEVITALIAIEKQEFINAGFGTHTNVSLLQLFTLLETPDLTDVANVRKLRCASRSAASSPC